MTCYIKKTIPCTSMPIAISPHTKGAILSSPAELTVNTLKVNVLCITRNEELLKKLKKNKKKTYYLEFSVYEIYIVLLNFFLFV